MYYVSTDGKEYGDDINDTVNTETRDRNRKIIHERVTVELRKSYEKSRIRYDRRTRKFEYKVGDLIYHRCMKLSDAASKFSAKLRPRYVKCEVIARMGSNTYKVKDVDGKHVGVYHTTQLKA